MLDGDLTNKVKYRKYQKRCEPRARVAQLIQLTKGYRIRRVLNSKVVNVLQAKLAYEVLVFLSRK
jgi:hypothetical protein